MPRHAAPITGLAARAYSIPTDRPEADGTFCWTRTTFVTVHASAGGQTGFGYSYVDAAAAALVNGALAESLRGQDALDIPKANAAVWGAVRNSGRSGVAACAISAIDLALWDLKAKLLGVPLGVLLGRRRDRVEIYGSGGFTNHGDATLAAQFAGWVEREGCRAVKMKIGRNPENDPSRVAAARAAIGDGVALFVDANGALDARRAIAMMDRLAEQRIAWFEEPVSSDDLPGLARVRTAAAGGPDIAAGEYVFTLDEARMMLAAGAVDVQQADATRCGGITGFLKIAALCEAFHTPLSGHCAPAAHLHVACAAPGLRHLEWFHDHARIEHMLFEGAPVAKDGYITPDENRLGSGLALKKDAENYAL